MAMRKRHAPVDAMIFSLSPSMRIFCLQESSIFSEVPKEASRRNRVGRTARILIVDDEPFNIDLLEQELDYLGYETLSAANGRQALELIDEVKFDAVLLDVMMPEMDGFAVLEHLRAAGLLNDLPVIVISALHELDNAIRCIELGAEDYLPKPFDPTLLRARINATLEKKWLRDEVAQQLAVIREVFGKYVPQTVAEAILRGKGELKPIQTTATILYTDIESFTSIVESMSPERVVDMLNEYFPAVIAPITRYAGVVNQFQGDAMLVTFNVPVADSHHADNAVKAAIEIQQALKDKAFAGVKLRTRIGINTGEVFAGNVGSGDRVNYTVHGDAVNLAARLEQLNKEHDSLVLVSGTTAAELEGTYALDAVGEVAIRGKSATARIFKLAV